MVAAPPSLLFVALCVFLAHSVEDIPTTDSNREHAILQPPITLTQKDNENKDQQKVGDSKFKWLTTSEIHGGDDQNLGQSGHEVSSARLMASQPPEIHTPYSIYQSDATVPELHHSHVIRTTLPAKALPIGSPPCLPEVYPGMSPSLVIGGPPSISMSYPPHPPGFDTTDPFTKERLSDNAHRPTSFSTPLSPTSEFRAPVRGQETGPSGAPVSYPIGWKTSTPISRTSPMNMYDDPCHQTSDPDPVDNMIPANVQPIPLSQRDNFDKRREHFCNITSTQNIISVHNCPSCRNRCGEVNHLSQKEGLCSCDRACLVYHDCCPDFHSECSEFTEALIVRDAIPGSPMSFCRGIAFESLGHIHMYLFINSCPYESALCFRAPTTKQGLLQALRDTPVMDVSTGVFYTNYKCAQCNGAKSIKLLQPILNYHYEAMERLLAKNNSLPIFSKQMSPDISYRLPDILPRMCVKHVADTCDKCPGSAIGRLCEHGPLLYTTITWPDIWETFKNVHCALCTSINAGSLRCGSIGPNYHAPPIKPSAFSLSMLFDFTQAGDPQFGKIQVRCDDPKKPLPDGFTCGKHICPSGLTLQGDACVDDGSQYTNKLEIRYHINSNNCLDNITWFDHVELETTIWEEFQTTTAYLYGKVGVTDVNLKSNGSNCLFDICVYIEYGDTATAQESLKAVRQQGSSFIMTTLYDAAHKSDLRQMTFTMSYTSLHWTAVESLTVCKGPVVDQSAYVIRNKTLILLSNGQRYSDEDYILQNQSAIICLDNETQLDNAYMSSDNVGILTIVLSTLSVVCLLIRLGLQLIQRRYHTAAGRMQCHLAAAICLATILLLVSPLAAHIKSLCSVMGVVKYAAFLAAFFWMACVAGDTWWALRNAQLCIRNDPNRSLIKFHLATWGMSICMATAVHVFDQYNASNVFKPNIGGVSCWITQKYPLIVLFFVPVFFSINLSGIFFVLSVLSLKQHINQNQLASHMDALKETKVYVKLFVLLGLTWSVAFVAVWVDEEAVWSVFVTLNSTQGIWLFLAFVLEWSKIRKFVASCRGLTDDETGANDAENNGHGGHPS